MTFALFGIENDGLNLAVNLLVFFLVVIWLALVYWTYADAQRRIDDPMLVGCATAASLFPFIGTIVYTIVRPPEYLEDARERELEIKAAEARLRMLESRTCRNCGAGRRADFLRCPSCMRKLREPCRSCGKPLDPRWKVCPYCETEVAQPETLRQPQRARRATLRARARAEARPARRRPRRAGSPAKPAERTPRARRRRRWSRTLILVKPDAFERGLTGEVIARFERKGLRIVALKLMTRGSRARGAPLRRARGEAVLRRAGRVHHARSAGRDGARRASAVAAARQVIGATEPARSGARSIRGDFATEVTFNLVHGSDSPESAEREIALFFPELLNIRKFAREFAVVPRARNALSDLCQSSGISG